MRTSPAKASSEYGALEPSDEARICPNVVQSVNQRMELVVPLNSSELFPFAEFDPVLRRDLNSVLASARRELESGRRRWGDRDEMQDRLVEVLKDRAARGERCPLRLFDSAVQSLSPRD